MLHLFSTGDELSSVKQWLQFNLESMDEVKIKWEQPAGIRRQYQCLPNITIHDILEKWLTYNQLIGYNSVC